METEPNNNDSSPAGLKHDVIDDVTGGLSSPPPSTLTLRMIMQGKEAGSIIGKKGDNVKKFREESGARINISDASCPERIVTITGSTQQIVDAFSMICRRFEEDLQSISPSKTNTKQLITLRLILPASQCGSLIGKGGAKIKEIREVAGASIQISGDMLANSTERLVTVSGSVDAVTRGIFHICQVMLECPAKGVTVPYRPKLALAPVIVTAGGQTYAVQGQYIVPQPVTPNYPTASGPGQIIQYQPMPPQFAKLALQQGMLGHLPSPYGPPQAFIVPQYPVGVSGYVRSAGTSLIHPATAAQQQQQQQQQQQHVHEMKIPNDLIGCIIGRGGSKINEIRQLSGANIKIAGVEEGCSDRTVTITGLPESIGLAQHLINARLVEWSYKGYV
jgi:poly(rC)-binding protein 2/3/4